MELVKIILNSSVIGGVLAAIVAGIFKLVRSRKNKEVDIHKILKNESEIIAKLQGIRKTVGADRAIILIARYIESEVESTVIYEDVGDGIDQVKKEWKAQIVDMHYKEMLGMIKDGGIAIMKKDDMEGGMLKDLYLAQNIHMGIVTGLHKKEYRLYYLVLNFVDGNINADQAEYIYRENLRVFKTNIQNNVIFVDGLEQ